METKTTVILPQAKECLESPEASQGTEGVSAGAIRRVALMTPGFQTSGLQRVITDLCCG